MNLLSKFEPDRNPCFFLLLPVEKVPAAWHNGKNIKRITAT
jgi:hypothetical protein